MGRKESVLAAVLKNMKSVCDHVFVLQRPEALDCILDEVRELVAESEGQKCGSHNYGSSLPSQPPYHEGYDKNVKRNPYGYVGHELPERVCVVRIPAVYFKGEILVESVYFLPGHITEQSGCRRQGRALQEHPRLQLHDAGLPKADPSVPLFPPE